eukprot:546095_1
MTSISSSILTSRTSSIIYGLMYGLFVISITIYALIEFLKVYNKFKKKQNSKKKNSMNDHIQLQIINNSKQKISATNTEKIEQKYDDDELELKYEQKEEEDDDDDDVDDNDIIDANDPILEFIESKNIDLNTFKGKLKFLFLSINNKRTMYLTILLHIFDTTTDIGVILDWYYLSQIEENYEENIQGIDMKGFFYLGVAILLFYRLISSIIIFIMTYSWKKFILQLFDLEL